MGNEFDLASTQIIFYIVSVFITVGIVIGATRTQIRNLKEDIDMLRTETREEIKELKRRANTIEEKLPQILTAIARIEVTTKNTDDNIRRIFDKIDRKDNEHN